MASPPPVEFSLQLIGEKAEERRQGRWALTAVDDGVVTYCGDFDGEVDKFRFQREGEKFFIDPDADSPWQLVWAVHWSAEPHRELSRYLKDWDEDSARYEVFDGQIVQCWGEDSKLCVDRFSRGIVRLEVDQDGQRWTISVTREGERIQVTRQGSPIARFALNGRPCEQ